MTEAKPDTGMCVSIIRPDWVADVGAKDKIDHTERPAIWNANGNSMEVVGTVDLHVKLVTKASAAARGKDQDGHLQGRGRHSTRLGGHDPPRHHHPHLPGAPGAPAALPALPVAHHGRTQRAAGHGQVPFGVIQESL
jgi:hypothetical protein